MAHISDIKLIRTDTTLDLSQKAEKGMLCPSSDFPFYTSALFIPPLSYTMWDSAFETSNREEAFLSMHLSFALKSEPGKCLSICCYLPAKYHCIW